MNESDEKINQLQARLDKMVEYQNYFYREINQIRDEIKLLQSGKATAETNQTAANAHNEPPVREINRVPKILPRAQDQTTANQTADRTAPPTFEASVAQPKAARQSNLEEFVGKNLISLIGIVITILGVGIGAKYAIDRDLISPTMRIILGYAFAAGLLAVALRLKNKYLNFSAVLLSGALAIIYFLTLFAYSFYALMPQPVAFLIMLVTTAFGVVAAINFNRQVIAHIGLVGAYAVPFLLSNNSGRADVLFGYMTIINFGILVISIKKFWKSLYYSSFIFTWLIYAVWFLSSYRPDEQFAVALGFAFVFFITFYLTFLSYKLIAKEDFNAEIVVLVLLNSFIFYGFGYAIINDRAGFDAYLGLFTLLNALINLAFAAVIYKYKLGDEKNLYLAVALAITFVTIAVPVQFRGSWITLLWTAEMLILFWLGRFRKITLYENLSYVLMILASLSLLIEWEYAVSSEAVLTPVFNRNFLTSILFAAGFAVVAFLNRRMPAVENRKSIGALLDVALPAIFLFALYNTLRIEIGNYFHARTTATRVPAVSSADSETTYFQSDGDLNLFNVVWQINYSMLFLAALSLVNIKKFRSATLGFANLGLNALVIFVFLTAGLFVLSLLRANYLFPPDSNSFPHSIFNIYLRYVSLAFAAALVSASYFYIKQSFLTEKISAKYLTFAFDAAFHSTILIAASSELINWMDIVGYNDSYKLGLSILWGFYALLLIVLGIVQRKKYLRIGAIGLFGLTLLKLFFYDISDLDTISKTVVFVVLGVLLLIVSFLYNKYKTIIFTDDEAV